MTRASPRFRSIAASELVTSTLKFCCVSLNFIVFKFPFVNQKILCAFEKIIVYQEISSYSGKDCCFPESIVVFPKRMLMCSEKGCCVLEKVVVFEKII